MKVLDLPTYDAILGYDWLSSNSPMTCDWANKAIQFHSNGQLINLCGLSSNTATVQEISMDTLSKWMQGNVVWSLAVLEPIAPDVPPSHSPQVEQVLQQYQTVFIDPKALPPSRAHDHHIPLLPNTTQMNSRPYRYSPLHKTEIERQVIELLQARLISHSTSPFASPVLLVQKKDGSWRFCVDYRKLNAVTVKNRFPMPVIEEILEELAGSKYFTKLDMRSGYHQVRMATQDEYKTAFKTHHGHFQFKVMPFELTNAPATFQCLMNDILGPFLRQFVLVFLDDILIYSPTLESHLDHIQQVLQILQDHHLYLKASKCSFAQNQLEYLDHIISAAGVSTDQSKIAAMVNWLIPTCVTELRAFLGLTGYYRRFVRNYGLLAKPLTQILKKKMFQWSNTAQQAFDALKLAMSTTPVLALPDFTKPFTVETDACDDGIGAVLLQNAQPIAFLSKALGQTHKAMSIYEKEFLALIMAVERWRSYLQLQEFVIITDHKSLAYLTEQSLHSDMQHKAMTRLMGLKFKIVYRQGKENTVADSLSRVGHLMALRAVATVQPAWVQEVINSYATDARAQTLLASLAIHSPDSDGFSLHQNIIRHNGKVWIGENAALQTRLINAMHSSAIGGHSGTNATYHRLKNLFSWKGMKQDVEAFVKQCAICQQAKHSNSLPAGLLAPLPIPGGVLGNRFPWTL